jgi:photosystem II stability/assembly factor-like uncharacterized protein
VADNAELERLYREAQSALKAKEYDRAARLLTQILVIDENYKDVSRLLAQSVKLKRRRWYSHPALWRTIGALLLLGLGFFIVPKISSFYAVTTPSSPTAITTATQMLFPTPISIPLKWTRINFMQFVERDEINALVIDPLDPDILYVGAKNSGVFRTLDGGISWQPASNGLYATGIDTLAIDSSNPKILYAAVSSGGVYKTEDRGDSWRLVKQAQDYWSSISHFIRIDPQNPAHLYYLNGIQIFESSDFGESWSQVFNGDVETSCPKGLMQLAIHPFDGRILAAVDPKNDRECGSAVYVSYDSGRTWQTTNARTDINNDFPDGNIVFDHQDGSTIYVALYDKVFKSSDTGHSWAEVYSEPCHTIAISPDDKNMLFCMPDKLYRSVNGGITWSASKGVVFPVPGKFLVISPRDSVTLYRNTSDLGLGITTDGGRTWDTLSNGLGIRQLELVIHPITGKWYLYNTNWSGPLYMSDDQGITWETLNKNEGFGGLAIDATGDVLYRFNTYGDLILRSRDGGTTWREISVPILHLDEIFAHPSKSGIVYSSGVDERENVYVFVSHDFGETWEKINDLFSQFYSYGHSGKFFFHPLKENVIYSMGNSNGYRTANQGFSWSPCDQDLYRLSRTATRFALGLDVNQDRVYAATQSSGVIISSDGCSQWMVMNNGINAEKVNSIVVDPINPLTVYAGTDNGFYISYNEGNNWNPLNEGLLGANIIYSIAIDPINPSDIYATTPYGIFKLDGK